MDTHCDVVHRDAKMGVWVVVVKKGGTGACGRCFFTFSSALMFVRRTPCFFSNFLDVNNRSSIVLHQAAPDLSDAPSTLVVVASGLTGTYAQHNYLSSFMPSMRLARAKNAAYGRSKSIIGSGLLPLQNWPLAYSISATDGKAR